MYNEEQNWKGCVEKWKIFCLFEELAVSSLGNLWKFLNQGVVSELCEKVAWRQDEG